MNKYIVPNLGKAVQMLKLISAAEGGLSAVEIEQQLSTPRTTAFRILKTLTHEGMVEKRGSQFFAGAGLFEIGLHALSNSKLREQSVPILQELTRQTGQTSHLAIPSGWHSLILEVCDSPNPVQVASRSGTLADLHCSATGKIFLSFLHRDRLAEYLDHFPLAARTANTLTKSEQLTEMIRQVCDCGYARDEEEYHPGVRCLAMPVFNMRSQVVAAIGVTGPTSSFTPDKIESVCLSVRQAASELSRALGYKPSNALVKESHT